MPSEDAAKEDTPSIESSIQSSVEQAAEKAKEKVDDVKQKAKKDANLLGDWYHHNHFARGIE